MKNLDIVNKVALEMETRFKGESSGHDWWHMYRVWKLAKHIAKKEKADLFVVELSALLHDIADVKFNPNSSPLGEVEKILAPFGLERPLIERIAFIVENISFSKELAGKEFNDKEGLIVRDADRLDAIGAMGIARAFAYGGKLGRVFHDPEQKPKLNDYSHYLSREGTTINHFYEKLLLLKDKMHTKTAKEIAQKRHKFMEAYLKEFFAEWEGNA